MRSPPCMILATILEEDEERISTNRPGNEKTNDDVGITSLSQEKK